MAPREATWAELGNGLRLPYVEQGERSGIPVVLLHGYVESWRYFEGLLGCLPSSIHAFALSQRGHGEADKPRSGYELDDFSEDVAAFLDAVDLEAAFVVGSSSGGYVAQRFALDHPQRVLGIVLIGSPRSLRDKPAVSEFLAAVSALDDPIDPAFVREFVESTLFEPLAPAVLDTLIDESRKAPAHVWKAAAQGLVAAVPPSESGTIAAPTLILWGDRDTFLPRDDQEALAAAIPGSELVTYEGVGHSVLVERTGRVAADLVAFVEAQST